MAISIHALVQRAAAWFDREGQSHDYFNPRPRAEGGQILKHSPPPESISIHALVQRAAIRRGEIQIPYANFNPRPRAEGG